MRIAIPLTALACSLASVPAHARARVFVASYGNDSNPCTFGSPCKTFQVAVNAVDAGGEVTAIDSAGFGPINITKTVTITSPAGVEAGVVPAAGGDGVDINAGPNDGVVLRGLTMNGSSGGNNGIVFNTGSDLTVIDCVVQDFLFDGIQMKPTSGAITFAITDTKVVNNSNGINYHPPSGSQSANGVIDHVIALGNGDGIAVDTFNTSGGTTNINICNSVVANNGGVGIFLEDGPTLMTVTIDNATISDNFGNGIVASNVTGSQMTVELGRSVITNNPIGINNQTSPNGFFSYGDNRINSNPQGDITSPLNPLALK
jgi:hypothetical protein